MCVQLRTRDSNAFIQSRQCAIHIGRSPNIHVNTVGVQIIHRQMYPVYTYIRTRVRTHERHTYDLYDEVLPRDLISNFVFVSGLVEQEGAPQEPFIPDHFPAVRHTHICQVVLSLEEGLSNIESTSVPGDGGAWGLGLGVEPLRVSGPQV
jgi:hypothetical protein